MSWHSTFKAGVPKVPLVGWGNRVKSGRFRIHTTTERLYSFQNQAFTRGFASTKRMRLSFFAITRHIIQRARKCSVQSVELYYQKRHPVLPANLARWKSQKNLRKGFMSVIHWSRVHQEKPEWLLRLEVNGIAHNVVSQPLRKMGLFVVLNVSWAWMSSFSHWLNIIIIDHERSRLSKWLYGARLANNACTRRLGLCAFSSFFRGLRLVPAKWRYLSPPSRR